MSHPYIYFYVFITHFNMPSIYLCLFRFLRSFPVREAWVKKPELLDSFKFSVILSFLFKTSLEYLIQIEALEKKCSF